MDHADRTEDDTIAKTEEQLDDALVDEEADAAAEEAAGIGGPVPAGEEEAAQRPLSEAGEGEAEGFELAERDLEDIASHGDQHRFPDRVVPPAEEEQDAAYGEADQEVGDDA